jgi:transposase InsO family protein
MPFEKRTVMEQRLEFCLLAMNFGTSFSDICRRFNISRRTGYKWLDRFLEFGVIGVDDLSRKPKHSPLRTSNEIEEYIVAIRKENPEWGSKKIHKILSNQIQQGTYPFDKLPCKNTITNVFARNGLISEEKSIKAQRWKRFEYEEPNTLWQMDFKGYFQLLNQSRCYPLTILDDHSRFNLGLFACTNEQHDTVKNHLIGVFRKYGLPEKILSDNGSPWGSIGHDSIEQRDSYSRIEKWLIRLNIKPIHGHAYHPQTQGKEERFHKTLKTELLNYELFKNHKHCQQRFDVWREKYNCKRPHEAIEMEFPVTRYKQSSRSYPEVMPPIEYNSNDIIRKVMGKGVISFKNKEFKVGKAFQGDFVALHQTNVDGQYDVYFCNQKIRSINLQ